MFRYHNRAMLTVSTKYYISSIRNNPHAFMIGWIRIHLWIMMVWQKGNARGTVGAIFNPTKPVPLGGKISFKGNLFHGGFRLVGPPISSSFSKRNLAFVFIIVAEDSVDSHDNIHLVVNWYCSRQNEQTLIRLRNTHSMKPKTHLMAKR